MVHLHAVRQLVHHHHNDASEAQPRAGVGAQYQLNHLASVEVAANELPIWWELFQSGYGEVMRFHDRMADGSYAGEKLLCYGRLCRYRAGKSLYENYVRRGRLMARVQALHADWHG